MMLLCLGRLSWCILSDFYYLDYHCGVVTMQCNARADEVATVVSKVKAEMIFNVFFRSQISCIFHANIFLLLACT